jgi:hypothetical protein
MKWPVRLGSTSWKQINKNRPTQARRAASRGAVATDLRRAVDPRQTAPGS